MSTIIKATDRNRGIHNISFNFEDMSANADVYLNKIRDEARKILGQAAQEAQAIRQRAEAEGRRAGQAAIEQTVNQQVAVQMQTVLPALRAAVESIVQAKPGWLAHWESQAIQLATAIAARVIRRELASDPQIPLKLVREALELAGRNTDVRLQLNPEDYAALHDQVAALTAEFSRLGPIEVVADPQISRGGCRVETRFGAIDQQIEKQLARIEAELI